ncbi:MAG: type II secretion system protein GspG, partial [Planctomycetota bacterium]
MNDFFKSVLAVFLGGVALVIYFNVSEQLNRKRQKRSVAELRSIATAIEAYLIEGHAAPLGPGIASLRRVLQPTFIQELPLRDAWGHPYQYTTYGNSYELRSLGSDGQRETSRPRG